MVLMICLDKSNCAAVMCNKHLLTYSFINAVQDDMPYLVLCPAFMHSKPVSVYSGHGVVSSNYY